MKIRKRSKASCVGVLSGVAALSLLAMAMVFPEINGAFAAGCEDKTASAGTAVEEGQTCDEGSIKVNFEVRELSEEGGNPDGIEYKTGNLTVNFTVNPFIEISKAPAEDLSLVFAGLTGAEQQSTATNFSVTTNSASGFQVMAKADNVLGAGTLGNITTNGNTAKLADFAKDSWGYAVTPYSADANAADINFSNITTSDQKLYGKDEFKAGEQELTLWFGANVNEMTAAGEYKTTVTISAVISSAEVPNIP